jgi:beta-phosphoglucomutase-like phosphatase (HAD superfamily)
MTMKIKGAIFDMDGTLIDSMEYWETAGIEYLKRKYV